MGIEHVSTSNTILWIKKTFINKMENYLMHMIYIQNDIAPRRPWPVYCVDNMKPIWHACHIIWVIL